ncbi:hypothetical protein SK128_016950 [Halocaridina rubra]|uniref:Fibronectin type-III domain-containing protein n=1 Tax=Halocaridina rubra TaxID=373956 RepID=A0AAN8ZNE5_HALRR
MSTHFHRFDLQSLQEIAPAGPPQDVSVHLVNLTRAVVTWRPPEADLQHGHITGYQILIPRDIR